MKFLIIDDSRINHKLARLHLERKPGDLVESAIDSMDGVEMAMISMPDLIMVDIDMPGYDGKETLKLLKKIKRTKDIPVIITGSDRHAKMRDQLIAMGAEDFIRINDGLSGVYNRLKEIAGKAAQPA